MTAAASRKKRLTLPQLPEYREGMNHTEVWMVLEADAAYEHLIKLSEAALKRNKFRESDKSRSIWLGALALRQKRDRQLRAIRDFGELLYCWRGTKALEVAA